jgi:hypothetical protein
VLVPGVAAEEVLEEVLGVVVELLGEAVDDMLPLALTDGSHGIALPGIVLGVVLGAVVGVVGVAVCGVGEAVCACGVAVWGVGEAVDAGGVAVCGVGEAVWTCGVAVCAATEMRATANTIEQSNTTVFAFISSLLKMLIPKASVQACAAGCYPLDAVDHHWRKG